MSPRIIECEQGTDAWYEARRGVVTASMFADVLAKGKGTAESKTRRRYLLQLAGERLTGVPAEPYSNVHLERGKEMEPEARDMYAFAHDAPLTRVGFILNGRAGCSPDALVGDDGALEIKTALPHILIDYLIRDEFPPEHKAQTQGVLWVTGRRWIDLAVYWPGLPLFVKRASRDEAYIADLALAVDAFNAELDETVERVRRYGEPRPVLRDALAGSLAGVA